MTSKNIVTTHRKYCYNSQKAVLAPIIVLGLAFGRLRVLEFQHFQATAQILGVGKYLTQFKLSEIQAI